MVKKEKEKIESKGAYSYDLHDAIRDVRRSLGRNKVWDAYHHLKSLYDICAPEIREAIDGEWGKIDRVFDPKWDEIENMELVYEGEVPLGVDSEEVFKQRQIEKKRNELKRDLIRDEVHQKLRSLIDCLDRHGELRRWREVDYGKI